MHLVLLFRSREGVGPMMFGMMGIGGFMMSMFTGFFDVFMWPMWLMMTGWLGLF